MSQETEKNLVKILIVDDEAELRHNIAGILRATIDNLSLQLEEASDGEQALEKVRNDDFDLVLMDVKMPKLTGLEALEKIKEHNPSTFVVLMTAHSNLNDAVAAIREGAYDYLEKPVHSQKLVDLVHKALEARDLVGNLAMSRPIFDDDVDTEFVGTSAKMRGVFDLVYRLSKVETTVLVRGENGTGKELVARGIHANSSRKNGPFVAINCGAIPENLMEAELFGFEKGAFTGAVERRIGRFQQANSGSLFLDEIGELRPEMQVKLLRVLQEKKFTPVGSNRELKTNARILAATNRNLEKMMEEGSFREDLFYRLNVMPIFLPPLRERNDDVPELVQTFIQKFRKTHVSSQIRGVSNDALELLKLYRWPGNIRELENVIERAFIVESSNLIQVASLPPAIQQQLNPDPSRVQRTVAIAATLGTLPLSSDNRSATVFKEATSLESSNHSSAELASTSGAGLDYETFKEASEKEFILAALKANQGRINQTVARANIPKNTLLRKIKKYGINVKEITTRAAELTTTPEASL